jgi:hypothetical protein
MAKTLPTTMSIAATMVPACAKKTPYSYKYSNLKTPESKRKVIA